MKTFCMFLSGDYIGLALNACWGGIKKFWGWLKNVKLFRKFRVFMDAYFGFYKMFWKIAKSIGLAIINPTKLVKVVPSSIDAI